MTLGSHFVHAAHAQLAGIQPDQHLEVVQHQQLAFDLQKGSRQVATSLSALVHHE